MKHNVREMYNEFLDGLTEVGKSNPNEMYTFLSMMGRTYKSNFLDTKTKELISIAMAVYTRCEYCIVYHVHKALETGATRNKIMEAAMVSLCFGAGPSMTYIVTFVKECLDEFEGDFQKQQVLKEEKS